MYGSEIRVTQLHYARAVIELGSFSKAAQSFGVSQPALSNGIAQLESALGGRVFERTTKGAALTRFGTSLEPLIARALTSVEALMAGARSASGRGAGAVRMGVSPLIHPALVARAFEATRSSDGGGLILREENLAELQRAVRARELDVAIVPAVTEGQGLRRREVDTEAMFYIAPGKRSGPDSPVELRELAGQPLVLVVDQCGLTTFVNTLFTDSGVELTPYAGEAHSYRNLVEWAELGLGGALLPESKLAGHAGPFRPLVEEGRPVLIGYEALWQGTSPRATEIERLLDEIA